MKHDNRGVEKTITMVLAAGVIAESIALAGTTINPFLARPDADLFRIAEESIEFTYNASSGFQFAEDVQRQTGELFSINSAEELRLAFAQQGKELNTTFFLNVKSDLEVREILKNIDAGLTRCTWKFQYAIDSKGNKTDATYHLYMFTVSYRDDFKVLQAFRNEALTENLTAGEIALKDEALRIIADIIEPGMSDYEKVLAVHDYIVLNGRYEDSSNDPVIHAALHKTEGILINGVGVCTSYAGSMYLLLNMIGVECAFVTGIARNSSGLTEVHAWNRVLISGDWYNFDATWNDLAPDQPGVVSYTYFGLTDKALAKTHDWDRDVYPQSAESEIYNYYNFNDLKSQDYAQFKAIVMREIMKQKGNPMITVNVFVENYDPGKYSMNFIYGVLPKIKKASCSRINGTSGELILIITQEVLV